MKAYELVKGCDSLDGMQQVERPTPRPGPGEILVRMRATSLNYRDQAVVTGNYFGGAVQRNTIPLSDGAGEVEEIGAGVTRFVTGDRVAGTEGDSHAGGRSGEVARIVASVPIDG